MAFKPSLTAGMQESAVFIQKQAKVNDSVQSWHLIKENAQCFMYILIYLSRYNIHTCEHGWKKFKEDDSVWWFGNAACVGLAIYV